MHFTLISPRLALQKKDFLGSGIPYWPLELATLAAHAREAKDQVEVIDLFGSDPSRLTDNGDHYLQGTPLQEQLDTEAVRHTDAFVLFAISYMSHGELLNIVRILKATYKNKPLAILENSQAVTAYSLQHEASAYFEAGATALICGEPYFNWSEIKTSLVRGSNAPVPSNILTPEVRRPPQRNFVKGAKYPIPAWDMFNLKGYWSLPYSHGPKTARFLPVLTSRGCPYHCDFCVIPETNSQRWRGNSPADVVDEIIALRDRYNVYDFQVEDVNPTVNHGRWEEICRLLVARRANIRFYLVSGTKAETVHIDQIPLLAAAGCRYLSISPEAGSKELMDVIGKPFNYQHGIELVSVCHAHGIRTQACFLVGHPTERERDFKLSVSYLRKMVRAGLDEVAIFIIAPFAGSKLYAQNCIKADDSAALPSFSPKGRENHEVLERRRKDLIRVFFGEKLKRGPELWLQGLRAILGKPQTKMENLPRRIIYILWLRVRARLGLLW